MWSAWNSGSLEELRTSAADIISKDGGLILQGVAVALDMDAVNYIAELLLRNEALQNRIRQSLQA